jgi:hypothetical protein
MNDTFLIYIYIYIYKRNKKKKTKEPTYLARAHGEDSAILVSVCDQIISASI